MQVLVVDWEFAVVLTFKKENKTNKTYLWLYI